MGEMVTRTTQPGDSEATLFRARARRRGGAILRFFRQKPLGAFGAVVVAIVVIAAVGAEFIAPYQYDEFEVSRRLQGPSSQHLFGTDAQGRDQLSRVIYGSRTSIIIGLGALAVAMVGATLIGVVSGWFGGLLDLITQRIIDIWLALPGLIFVIFLVAIFGRTIPVLLVSLGLLFVAGSSRIVRSATLGVIEFQYMEAARAMGASNMRIMARHILPNIVPIIIVSFSIQIGSVILIESALAFLGYGLPAPFPSWGRMLQEAQTQMLHSPYLAFFPGAAIALTVFSFNVFGDALRDVLDPRLRSA